MKTMQELYEKIISSKELKAQFIEAAKAGKTEAFLREHGCDATMEEVAAFLKEKTTQDAPLSLNELENAAGGECNNETGKEIMGSVLGILGVYCAVTATYSAVFGYVGQKREKEGRLCNEK